MNMICGVLQVFQITVLRKVAVGDEGEIYGMTPDSNSSNN